MKNSLRKSVLSLTIAMSVLLGSSCRAVQINQLEKRVAQLETRVSVLESQVASQPRK